LLGKIYEFFLGKFGLEEAQKGGEFFTPTSVVKLMVEFIEPYHGKIFDPACGSGGMFVQSNNFIQQHNLQKGSVTPISVYGQEKTMETVKLAKMNLAINGLRGEIKQGDSYAEDLYDSFGKFDFVMANPPFNVKEVNEDTVKKDRRFTEYGLPKSKSKTKSAGVTSIPNGNYLWISLFATSLNETGKAALVMSNSASDAGHSEYDIRKTLVRKGIISSMLTLPSNMFSTVTLPATLWFFDKANSLNLDSSDFSDGHDLRQNEIKNQNNHENQKNHSSDISILFVDARNVFHQVDRAHREFTEEQLQNLAAINNLRKGNNKFFIELVHSHYANAVERMPIVKELLENINKNLTKQFAEFSKWVNTVKPTDEQKAILEKEKFFELLKKIQIAETATILNHINKAITDFEDYKKKYNADNIEATNTAQHVLLADNENLLQDFHLTKKELEKNFRDFEKLFKLADDNLKSKEDKAWKALGKPKDIRISLDKLNEYSNPVKNNNYEDEEKSPVYLLKMAEWLQQRFPKAQYEDVTGLCKLATIADIEEQDYSLNPGRYVGVVIEEDGMTEDEFEIEIKRLNSELNSLNASASGLENLINQNIVKLFEE
ncbi:MAG: N-6 DNA methylase, partial [Prolixibacteraceae bacterium]|nr:N-6 DNA methylase [Prolixibacteraceae bacterium]